MACNANVRWITMIFPVMVLLHSVWPMPPSNLDAGHDDQFASPADTGSNGSRLSVPESSTSCRNPSPAQATVCLEMERQILDSTVRFVVYSKVIQIEGLGLGILGGNGYATVKDGRYLVTHNHYDAAIVAMLRQGDPDNLLTIRLQDVNGQTILWTTGQAVLSVMVDHETIVLDFGLENGIGPFAALGVQSANFMASPAVPLQPGTEVAQIDADGSKSHVTWVTIAAIIDESGTTAVKTSGCLNPGASGGGLFWQGHHIGNNWSTTEDCIQDVDAEGIHYSIVALNSQLIATPS